MVPGLIERDVEIERFRSSFEMAAAGRGRVIFVVGEPGIGKSALVRAALDDARGLGARVAVGRCDPLSVPRSLGPFIEIGEALDVAGVADRDELFASLVGEVRRSPWTVAALEDVHWADGSSIELLGMLGRRAADLPLVVVATCREVGVEGGEPLRAVVGDLVASGGAGLLTLHPLSAGGVASLADGYDAVDAAELHRWTGGNPFYVTEVLAGAGAIALPPSIQHAVAGRAARLGVEARAVLDVVAVVPGRTERWLLDDVVPDGGVALSACVAAAMLVVDADHVGFRHELARLAIDAELGADVRRALHRRVAAALGQRGADPARVAHHAAAAGDEAVAARAAADAALAAGATGGLDEAVSHGQRALALSAFLDPDEVASLQEVVARAMAAGAENAEAVRLAQAAADHWRSVGDRAREAKALVTLAGAASGLGRAPLALAAAERAVDVLEHESPGNELAAAYAAMTGLHMLDRDRDGAAEWGAKAVSLASSLGDYHTLGRALIQSAIAELMEGRFDAVEQVREAMGIGRHHDEPDVVSLGYMQLGSVFGELRQYDRAVPALVEGIAWSADHGFEAHRRYETAWLARCRFDVGEWPAAEALARDSLAGSRSAGTTVFVALTVLGWLRARRGDGDVWPALDEALAIARQTGQLQRLWPVAVARAEAGWLEGDLDSHVPLLLEVAALAAEHRGGLAGGELGMWLGRAGHDQVDVVATDPFSSVLRGDPAGAAAGFLQLGCPYEAAHALADTDSTSSLRQALATFQRLGALPMTAIVAERLRVRGVRVGNSVGGPVTEASELLTERELEVIRLVAAGFTNPQIAATLYINRKTAEHHVSNILVKLGVTTRTEAAAVAARLGLVDA